MNGKKRYIPIVALGALLLTLLAILPVAAAGEVSFIDPTDINDDNDGALTDTTPDAQEWSRQGGKIGIFVDDSDLDAPVRRVLIPFIDTLDVGDGNIERNGNVITITYASANAHDLATTTGLQTVQRDDLVMVGYETLRKVSKVEWVDNNDPATQSDATDDTLTITLDRAYHARVGTQGTPTAIHIVKRTYVGRSADSAYDAFDGDGYKRFASGVRLDNALAQIAVVFPGHIAGDTRVTLDRDIADSGIGSHAGVPIVSSRHEDEYVDPSDHGLSVRLKSATGRGVRADDVLVVEVQNRTNSATSEITTETYPISQISSDGTFHIEGNRVGNTRHQNAYVLFWASEENETGSSVSVRSQAYQTSVPIVLRETTANSGEFAAKIDLIASEARIPWADIPEGKAGSHARLSNASTNNDTYDDYLVEIPSATRPTSGDLNALTQKVEFVTDVNQIIPRLPVNQSDNVTVRHPDDTGRIRIETRDSVFSGFSPAHDSTTRDSRPELSATVIDSDSGLDDSDVDIVYTLDNDAPLTLEPDVDGYVDDAPGGFSVRIRVPNVGTTTDREIKWWVKATDKAGNVTYSDRQRSKDGKNDFCTVKEDNDTAATAAGSQCDPYIVTVDNTDPSMERAETGRFWDPSLSTGNSDDKTEYRASKASRNSILVVFDEHLDIGSVQARDFEVNDATPSSADVFNVTVRDDNFQQYSESPNDAPTGTSDDAIDPDTGDGNSEIAGDDVQDEGIKRGYVFLTVGEMTTNARPKVELVDNVEDKAGNRRNSGTIQEATDRIGPTLAASFSSGDRPVTRGDVVITVTSDEDIGEPTVTYYRVKSTTEKTRGKDSVQLLDTERTDAVVEFQSAREYEVTITAPTDGLYTVFVEADDSAGGNPGSIGDKSAPVDVDDDTTAVLFERDKSLSEPDFDPGTPLVQDKFETDDANGFLRIDYSAEAKEYYAVGDDPMVCNEQVATPNCDLTDIDPDTDGDQAPNKIEVAPDDLDTYGRVTLVSATFDGADISGDLHLNQAGNIFQYHLADKAVGEYDLEIVVEDEAGNRNAAAHKAKIKIIERKKYALELNPGWNLVSLPGQPVDSDIDAVIPADHPIDAVSTYDPMVPGKWITSLQAGDGTFGEGQVKTIEAGLAYWIRTTSFQELEVDIPKITPGAAVTPPIISISQGWNLIPILDVDGDFNLADQTSTSNYFSGLTSGTVSAIYTFDTITNSWASVDAYDDDPDDDTPKGVQLGKGYWVYATKPGVIVP